MVWHLKNAKSFFFQETSKDLLLDGELVVGNQPRGASFYLWKLVLGGKLPFTASISQIGSVITLPRTNIWKPLKIGQSQPSIQGG